MKRSTWRRATLASAGSAMLRQKAWACGRRWTSTATRSRAPATLAQTPRPPRLLFGDGELARVSRTPLLTPAECTALVAEADRQDDSWCSGSRTAQYAARAGSSISVTQLPTALRLVNERLLPALLPAIGDAFPTAFRDVLSLSGREFARKRWETATVCSGLWACRLDGLEVSVGGRVAGAHARPACS